MKISIVIATFNASRYLADCLDACIQQTWQEKEIVVVDGGSTDGTVDIIRRYEQHIAFWHSKRDTGVYDAWNRAIDHVTGEWVLFLGADDVFDRDDVLERAALHLSCARPNEPIVYGSIHIVSEGGEYRGNQGEPWVSAKRQLAQRMTLPHPAVFHQKAAFARHGKFDPTFRVAGDYEFMLRVLSHEEAKFIPDLVVTRVRVGGLSMRGDVRVYFEAIRARRINGVRGFPWTICGKICSLWKSKLMWGILRVLIGKSLTERIRDRRRRSKQPTEQRWPVRE